MSRPRNTGPFAVEISLRLATSLPCLSKNSLRFSSVSNSLRIRVISASTDFAFASCEISVSMSEVLSSYISAAPIATNSCAFSGVLKDFALSFKVSSNWRLSWGKKCKGPPRNTILPFIGLPCARPLIVWVTTAWRIDAAISSRAAPSFKSGWTSDFAKTPQRAAIG